VANEEAFLLFPSAFVFWSQGRRGKRLRKEMTFLQGIDSKSHMPFRCAVRYLLRLVVFFFFLAAFFFAITLLPPFFSNQFTLLKISSQRFFSTSSHKMMVELSQRIT